MGGIKGEPKTSFVFVVVVTMKNRNSLSFTHDARTGKATNGNSGENLWTVHSRIGYLAT